MNTYRNLFQSSFVKPVAAVVLTTGLLIAPLSVFAAPIAPIASVSSSALSGVLARGYSARYLTVQPTVRDGVVTLTLNTGAQNDANVAGKVNMWVVSASGLHDIQSGLTPQAVAIAGGNSIQGKDANYNLQASWQAVGTQPYTVIVYSRSLDPSTFALSANNATLVDPTGESTMGGMVNPKAPAVPAPLQSVPMLKTTPTQMQGQVSKAKGNQYYTVRPAVHDGVVTLRFDYNPIDNSQLNGKIEFYVFTQEGLHLLVGGSRPETVNLAAGNMVKVGSNQLQAQFKATGDQSYTVMVRNQSNVVASYTLAVDNGNLQ